MGSTISLAALLALTTAVAATAQRAPAIEEVLIEVLAGPHGTGGNQVIVAHKDGENSSYAHLMNGSIRVKKGDNVKRGQVLGQIGLSGDGYEPHLHFQITDGPDIEYSRGIPAIFGNVRPVRFSSTIDDNGRRQLQSGEFVETVD